MQTLKIEVLNVSYKSTLNISNKKSINNNIEKLFKNSNVQIFKEIKDPIVWQKSIRDEW